MTKENAKDFMPLVQALAEGKTIQHLDIYQNKWLDLDSVYFDDAIKRYRIKPETEYVPFDTVEEFIEYWNAKVLGLDLYGIKATPALCMPSIWVKNKERENETDLITSFDSQKDCSDSVFLQDIWVDLKDLFETYTFLDGSPIGKIKE